MSTLYRRRGKRLLDVAVAAAGLVLTSPVQAAAALVVGRDLGSPVLFRQQRPGFGGRPFTLVKFRTMRDSRVVPGLAQSDAERLTPLGRWLRATSIDELPELWNVLRGDMSLVGPRPLLLEYLDRYTPEQARRHEARPGLTGLAQVSGRNKLSWSEKFALDVWYVDNMSIRLDLWIMWRTIRTVATRRGVTASDAETMPEFKGVV